MKATVSKTFRMGPLNLTVSPSGLSASVGVPGARLALNTKGQGRIALGWGPLKFQKSKKIF